MAKSKTKKKTRKKVNKKKTLFSNIKDKFISIKKSILGESDDNTTFSIMEVIIVIFISILFGIMIGYLINFTKNPRDSRVEEIVNTYNGIVDEYYSDVDKDKLADAAIKGMIESLEDPYSNYMDDETADEFNEKIDGTFVGIGVVVMYDGEYNQVIEVYEGEPAEKAGIKVDDRIIAVDDTDVKEVYGEDLVKLIRGKAGTTVKVRVLRGEEEKEFTIKRDKVDIKSVDSKVFEEDGKKIGYIRIETFASNTYTQFNKTIKKLEKKKIDSLILDVRSNPGGHLLQTRQILSMFFNRKTVLYQIKSKNKKTKVHSYTNTTRDYPVVVLIDGGSASASEILASCFKDNYKKATIIGTTSYGKGTVQKSQSLKSGNSIKYTTEKWLTSKGKWLNEKGVKPDIEVVLSDEYFENPTNDNDNQLQEAIKQLKESK